MLLSGVLYIPHMADRDLNISLIVDTQLLPHGLGEMG